MTAGQERKSNLGEETEKESLKYSDENLLLIVFG